MKRKGAKRQREVLGSILCSFALLRFIFLNRVAFIPLLLVPILCFSFRPHRHFSPSLLQEAPRTGLCEGEPISIAGPLRFLGYGKESIAFVTQDGNFVVKFFLKEQVVQLPRFVKPLKRLKELFSPRPTFWSDVSARYEDLFKQFPEAAAIISIHTKQTGGELPLCQAIDYRGWKHTLDLNRLSFVIQKKANVLSSSPLSSRERRVLAEKFRELFSDLALKGFLNATRSFNPDNYALLSDKAVMIDAGKLFYVPCASHAENLSKMETLLSNWAH
jgi:hypothetical protein